MQRNVGTLLVKYILVCLAVLILEACTGIEMKYNLKTLIYIFFTLIGLIHIGQLIWWYSIVISDYNEVHKKIDLALKTNFKQKILVAADICNNDPPLLRKICTQCEDLFKTEISDRITNVQINLQTETPILLKIIWSSDIGFIKKRFAEYDISKDIAKYCGNKNEK